MCPGNENRHGDHRASRNESEPGSVPRPSCFWERIWGPWRVQGTIPTSAASAWALGAHRVSGNGRGAEAPVRPGRVSGNGPGRRAASGRPRPASEPCPWLSRVVVFLGTDWRKGPAWAPRTRGEPAVSCFWERSEGPGPAQAHQPCPEAAHGPLRGRRASGNGPGLGHSGARRVSRNEPGPRATSGRTRPASGSCPGLPRSSCFWERTGAERRSGTRRASGNDSGRRTASRRTRTASAPCPVPSGLSCFWERTGRRPQRDGGAPLASPPPCPGRSCFWERMSAGGAAAALFVVNVGTRADCGVVLLGTISLGAAPGGSPRPDPVNVGTGAESTFVNLGTKGAQAALTGLPRPWIVRVGTAWKAS
jgi:hypothetical protein